MRKLIARLGDYGWNVMHDIGEIGEKHSHRLDSADGQLDFMKEVEGRLNGRAMLSVWFYRFCRQKGWL